MPEPLQPEDVEYRFSMRVLTVASVLVLGSVLAIIIQKWTDITLQDVFMVGLPVVCGAILVAFAVSSQRSLRHTRRGLRVAFEAVFRKRNRG